MPDDTLPVLLMIIAFLLTFLMQVRRVSVQPGMRGTVTRVARLQRP